MRRALTAATAYILILFTLGFVLGIIRVTQLIPRIGELAATIIEAPVMLMFGFGVCRWTLQRWNVADDLKIRLAMAIWFIILLFVLETFLGSILFGRTLADQWAALKTISGILGLSAQLLTAFMPIIIGRANNQNMPLIK